MKKALITGVTGQDGSYLAGLDKKTRFYQASTSELFGKVQEMCAEMVAEDLKVAKRHFLLREHGHDIPVAHE